MTKQYTIYIRPAAWDEIRRLPGHIRQRIRRSIADLSLIPRPVESKPLTLADTIVEVRRIRIDRWRIIYTLMEEDKRISIIAIRKRPPYDYGDLEQLLDEE